MLQQTLRRGAAVCAVSAMPSVFAEEARCESLSTSYRLQQISARVSAMQAKLEPKACFDCGHYPQGVNANFLGKVILANTPIEASTDACALIVSTDATPLARNARAYLCLSSGRRRTACRLQWANRPI